MIKILHTGDWHLDADPRKLEKAERSLEQIYEYLNQNKIQALVNSGDIWEKKQRKPYFTSPANEGAGIVLAEMYLTDFSKYVDGVFIAKGNNAHDEKGSVAELDQLEINIFAVERPACFGIFSSLDDRSNLEAIDLLTGEHNKHVQSIEYIISLFPYPTKELFIQDKGIDENNADFDTIFNAEMDKFAEKIKQYNCPKIMAFHGNVQGARLSNGQSLLGQDIIIAPGSLKRSGHHYYALAHIHLPQQIESLMRYSGSLYNKNWGETEQKYFNIVSFSTSEEGPIKEDDVFSNGYYINVEQIPLKAARPMFKIDAVFENGILVYDKTGIPDNAEIKFRYQVKEDERELVTQAKLDEIKKELGDDIRFDAVVSPVQRDSRSAEIMNAETLLEEVEEYAKVTNGEFTKTIRAKVELIEREVV